MSKPKTVATTDIKPFPSLAEEALKDAEDPCRIYWDMTFVFRTISDEDRLKLSQKLSEPPRKDFTPRKTHWRHHRKKKPFNHEVFVKKAQLAGLVTSSYLSTQEDEIYVRVGRDARKVEEPGRTTSTSRCLYMRLGYEPWPDEDCRSSTSRRWTSRSGRRPPTARTPLVVWAFEYIHGKFDTKEELEPLYLRTHEHAYHGRVRRSLFNSMRRLKLDMELFERR